MSGQTLIIVTADKIADTGEITWKYMFDADIPVSIMDEICELPWGYVWIPDRQNDCYTFNIFESGKMLVGGGWAPQHDTEEWARKMLDAIPACSLLMTTEVFEWLKVNVLDKFERSYQRHHTDKILVTS